jgi:hypothetical protein
VFHDAQERCPIDVPFCVLGLAPAGAGGEEVVVEQCQGCRTQDDCQDRDDGIFCNGIVDCISGACVDVAVCDGGPCSEAGGCDPAPPVTP